jgi:hypothetical protein
MLKSNRKLITKISLFKANHIVKELLKMLEFIRQES